MHLIDNAGQVWHRFWSLRFAALAAVLSAASVVATMALPEHTSLRVAFGVGLLTLASSAASVYARLVKQPAIQARLASASADPDPVRAAAIGDVIQLIAAHGLTERDVFGDDHADH